MKICVIVTNFIFPDANGQILSAKPAIPKKPVIPLKVIIPTTKPKPQFFAPLRVSVSPIRQRSEPIYATIHKTRHPKLQLSTSALSTFQNGGNLDDLLKDLSLSPSIEATSYFGPDIIMAEATKHFQSPISTSPSSPTSALSVTPTPTKKCRSEINLVLSLPDLSQNNQMMGYNTFGNSHPIGFEQLYSNKEKQIMNERIYEKVEDNCGPLPDTSKPPLPNGVHANPSASRKASPVIDIRRKSRRVSLSFSTPTVKKTVSKDRRASIDVISPTNTLEVPLQRRNSTHSHHHHHRRISVSSDHLKSGSNSKSNNKDDGGPHENGSANRNRRSLSRDSTGSTNTQKSRKASISSYGGKIPWCGCWGNGCF